MSAQSKALQKIQIASMREKLKLDKAKARKAVADAPSEKVLGPNGRPRVRYKDMPELHPDDENAMVDEFNRLACPHAAVLTYRPGYEGRGFSEDHAKESWWFYDQGAAILMALQTVLNGPHKEALEAGFAQAFEGENFNIRTAFAKMNAFLIYEKRAKMRAAERREMSLEASTAIEAEESAEIWDSLKTAFIDFAATLSDDKGADDKGAEDKSAP